MMNIQDFLNKEIELKISDPIDFHEENGYGPYRGKIVDIKPTSATIFLISRLYYRGEPIIQIKARTCMADATFVQLCTSKFLAASFSTTSASISQLNGGIKLIS